MENDAKKRAVNFDSAVVFDESELAESVHEEADSGSRRADQTARVS